VNHWINVSVALNDTWDAGAAHSLSNPLNRMPEFSLRPRYLRDGQGKRHVAHFSLDFSSGYLDDGWQGITFTPMGTDPVTGIANLPVWDAQYRQVYRDMINKAAGSLDSSRTARLEAIVPYLEHNKVAYNFVRLFYVEKAVQGNAHLVVVRVKSFIGVPGGVQARQDGSGQGPPH
jgi:hypothetical protein